MIILETERLILRHFHIFDGEAMARVFGDPEVMRYGPGVQTQAWIRDWLQNCLEDYRRLGFGPWAMVSKLDRTVIGYASLFHFPDIDGQSEIEVGYRLAKSYWGHGLATETVMGILQYAFHVLCLPRLIALIDPQNTASIRVAEKAGMHYKKDVMLEGYDYPDHLYLIRNSDYNQRSV
jgi:[ribosomal protein S5]-alanine N-acetyltransferase